MLNIFNLKKSCIFASDTIKRLILLSMSVSSTKHNPGIDHPGYKLVLLSSLGEEIVTWHSSVARARKFYRETVKEYPLTQFVKFEKPHLVDPALLAL